MTSTITAAVSSPHPPAGGAPPPKPAAPANSATGATQSATATSSASAASSQQKAALAQLLAKYKSELSRGAAASTLASLAKQITAAARSAGQTVSLPQAQASSGAASANSVASNVAGSGKLNVTA